MTNRGDRPIQVGSHYHFIETNRALEFDRAAAYGMRLDIPAGTAVRFEPGETRTVDPCRYRRTAGDPRWQRLADRTGHGRGSAREAVGCQDST